MSRTRSAHALRSSPSLWTPARRTALLGLALSSLLVGACGDPAPPEGGDKPVVALVMKSLANEFFATMEQGAREHHAAHEADYELISNGIKNESDLAQQVALVEQMIARGVDAIVIAPADSKALVPVLARASSEGIVVVNIDNRLDEGVLAAEDLTLPFVGPDNREGARLVGEALVSELEPNAKVGIIGGIPTAFNAQQRQAGFEDALTAAGIEIVSIQSAGWEQEPANRIAAAMLSEHPDLAALLCANDNMALGAAAAVRQSGRDVAIVGFDNIAAAQELVRTGEMLATADQHADLLAVYGIETALEILSGEAQAADRQTPVDLVTRESL